MGCAACFKGNVQEPHRKGLQRDIVFLEEELKLVKPCQLVAGDQFQKHWQRVTNYCERAQARRPIKRQEDNQLVQRELRTLRDEVVASKWKLLIFCRGFDFYEKQEDQLNRKLTHDCFGQIQKDLHRTFPEQPLFQTQAGSQQLQACLQRFALYFPRVGYTQGVNFIMGYLMLRGYCESDTFWLGVYFALSQKHLLLGLFEDGFPLATIYCRLFRLLLRQKLPRLHARMAELGVSDQIWIFKWFMTYFLYSFPLEAVEQVWDVTVMVGGVGLVYFAYAIVEQLQAELIQCGDDSEVAVFLSGLRDQKTFSEFVILNLAVSRSYEIQLTNQSITEEMRNLKEEKSTKQSFYLEYYLNMGNAEAQLILLDQWYKSIKSERIQFRNKQLQEHFEVQPHNLPIFKYKKRETKFRVKDQQRKEQMIKIDTLRKSQSICSHNSSASDHSKSNSRKISQLASSRQSQCLPSEQSIAEIIESQQTDRSHPQQASIQQPDRLNASVIFQKVQSKPIQQSHEQHEVEIFELKGKAISFKKKKNSENSSSKVNNKIFRKISERSKISRKATSIKKAQPRQILQSIENQDRSVIEFQGSSNIVSSVSDNKVVGGSPQSIINESMKAIELDDHRCTQSVQIESVR